MDTRLLALATQGLAEVLGRVRHGQGALPTPCDGWTVTDLIEHVVSENYAFGSAVCPPGRPAADRSGGSPARAYRDSSGYLLDRFAELGDGDLDRPVAVAGLPGERPASELYEMQIADTLIHTWDLARAIQTDFTPDPEVLALALRRMRQVPDAARGAGRPFGRALDTASLDTASLDTAASDTALSDTASLDTVLRLSGRDPNHAIHR